MKKYTLALLAVIAPVLMFSLLAQDISAKKPIYLHKQKKSVRSSTDHLQQFTAEGDVILDFYVDWCKWCKDMVPTINNVARTMSEFAFIKINRDFFPELKELFNITSVPTLIFLHNGKEIGRYHGKFPLSETELQELITNTYSTH